MALLVFFVPGGGEIIQVFILEPSGLGFVALEGLCNVGFFSIDQVREPL